MRSLSLLLTLINNQSSTSKLSKNFISKLKKGEKASAYSYGSERTFVQENIDKDSDNSEDEYK